MTKKILTPALDALKVKNSLTTRGIPRKSNAGRKPSAAGPLVSIGEVLVSDSVANHIAARARVERKTRSKVVHEILTRAMMEYKP